MPVVIKWSKKSNWDIEEIPHHEWAVMGTARKFYRMGIWEKITNWVYARKLHKKNKNWLQMVRMRAI